MDDRCQKHVENYKKKREEKQTSFELSNSWEYYHLNINHGDLRHPDIAPIDPVRATFRKHLDKSMNTIEYRRSTPEEQRKWRDRIYNLYYSRGRNN